MKDFGVKTLVAGFSAILALLCLLVSELPSEAQTAVFSRNGGASSIAPLRLHEVEVPADQLAAIRSSSEADPQLESVEENTTRSSGAIASDALYSDAATPTILTSLDDTFTIQSSDTRRPQLRTCPGHAFGSPCVLQLLRPITRTTKEQAIGGSNLQVHQTPNS